MNMPYAMNKLHCLLLSFTVSVNVSFAQVSSTPAAERLQGISIRKKLEEQSIVSNVKFRNIGPTIMSGRAVDLDVNPEDATEFYVAYASGGLWHTRNNGQSFVPLFDNEDVITIGDFAVDWKSRNIWIGTGEVNSSRSSYSGTGMYFSSDSGRTWTYKGLPESHHIGKVIIHPNDKNIVWVAVLGHLYSPNPERGVYKTTDGGANWQQVLKVDDNTGAVDMQIDPSDPNVLYAAMWHRERRAWNFVECGKTSGIYKSTDGGVKWSLISGEGSGFPYGDGVGRIGLDVFHGNSSILYAVVDNHNKRVDEEPKDTSIIEAKDLKGITKESFLALNEAKLDQFLSDNDFPEKYTAAGIKELVRKDSIAPKALVDYLNDANNSLFDTPIIGAELYRSEDAGRTWKKTNQSYIKSLFYTYGYYFGKVTVSPRDDKKVALCGVPVVLSRDGGRTFKSINGDNVHADHHAVWMNPKKDGHIIICNDGGLNISYDDGESWFKANSPAVGQFYSVNVDMAKPYNVYGGLQDNGVWTAPSNASGSTEWFGSGQHPYRFLMGGDGMQVAIDTRDNATVYTGYQFGYYYRLNKNNPDDGKSVKPRNDIGEPNYRFNWQSPVWLSTHNQDILYFGSNRFHRSMNKGDDMKTLSDDLTNANAEGDVPFNTITTIHESPLRFGLIYAGTDDGNVWISKDAGYSWSRIHTGLPVGLYVSRVIASAHKEGRVYVTLNGYRNDHFKPYVFVSENYGSSWTAISEGLPYEPVNVIREDPARETILFVGTDNGLYVTLDRGKRWMAMNGGLPRVAVHDLVVHPREGEIVLGTHGRSLYIAPLEHVRLLDDSTLGKQIALFPIQEMRAGKYWGKRPNEFYDPVKPELTIPFYRKSEGLTTLRLLSEKGLELQSWTDTSEAGINFALSDLAISEGVVKSFEKEMRVAAKVKTFVLAKSEDGRYYLPAGKYSIEAVDEKGVKSTVPFAVTSGK